MKNFILFFGTIFLTIACSTTSKNGIEKQNNNTVKDTIRIANEELEYEVIIIEPGFNTWLVTRAKPRGFYGESYLESRNQLFASEWNNRVIQPLNYNSNLYEMQINYDSTIHYGYEVNYLIYNYFMYFQLTYKQQLSGFVPRY